MKNILPSMVYDAICSSVNLNKIYEIRIRVNSPILINYLGQFEILKANVNGVIREIFATTAIINEIILKASEYSIYSVNSQIKKGYITCKNGIRVGLSGEVVFGDSGEIITIKNISSVNIRLPHEVRNCALTALNFILTNEVKSTLIIAPPGAGKTTFLRDIARGLGKYAKILNVLIIDERMEIANVVNGKPTLDIGDFADVISNSTKKYGFEEGVRSLRPDVIICDELMNEEDCESVLKASLSGVCCIATTHGNKIYDVKNKYCFSELLQNKTFKRFIVLSNRNGAGTYEGIYDENFELIYG